MNKKVPDDLITYDQAASLIGVCRRSLHNYVARHWLTRYEVDRVFGLSRPRYRVSRAEVEALATQREFHVSPPPSPGAP